MTYDYDFSSEELKEFKKFVHIEKKLQLDSYNIDKEIAWFGGIMPENVDLFCKKLYDMTQKHHC